MGTRGCLIIAKKDAPRTRDQASHCHRSGVASSFFQACQRGRIRVRGWHCGTRRERVPAFCVPGYCYRINHPSALIRPHKEIFHRQPLNANIVSNGETKRIYVPGYGVYPGTSISRDIVVYVTSFRRSIVARHDIKNEFLEDVRRRARRVVPVYECCMALAMCKYVTPSLLLAFAILNYAFNPSSLSVHKSPPPPSRRLRHRGFSWRDIRCCKMIYRTCASGVPHNICKNAMKYREWPAQKDHSPLSASSFFRAARRRSRTDRSGTTRDPPSDPARTHSSVPES